MDKNMFIAIAAGGALIYLASSGKLSGVAGTAAVCVGTIVIAKRVPVISNFV